jgi:cytochrome c oxidase subunit 3
MSIRENKNRHFFHIVDKSPWPICIAIMLCLLTSASVNWFHTGIKDFIIISIISILIISSFWFRDIVRESSYEGHHTKQVQNNIKYGMSLFITSEIMFFFSFFWSFFHSSLSPTVEIGTLWPPMEINILQTWSVPALNTIILLTSGASITWAHYALIINQRKDVILGFLFTLILSTLFTFFQIIEYKNAPYSFSDGIYGAIFYIMTGFHGIHVFLGTCFLIVCFFRFIKYHFTAQHHIGFQTASWYWHFVDVVWIFLFATVYVWGNYSL